MICCFDVPASDLPLSDPGVKVDAGESDRRLGDRAPAWQESAFLKACRGERTDFTPVWLMRQAGRFLPEYRAIRERLGFLELCRTPDAAAEVTLLPVEKLGVDAAILFADILLLVEPLGVGLEFARGEGPVIRRPVRSAADVERLVERDPAETVPFVFETVRRARACTRPFPGRRATCCRSA